MGGTYIQTKKERKNLVACRQTAEKLLHRLITNSQGSESFRQWSVRVADKLAQFFCLAVNAKGQEHDDTVRKEEEKCTPLLGKASRISVDDLLETVMKFLNFKGCSKDHLLIFSATEVQSDADGRFSGIRCRL